MAIKMLDHVNIRTEHLDETIQFYKDVLGMHTRPAAPGRVGVNFLYDERELPVLHLLQINRDDPEKIRAQEKRLAGLNHRIPDVLKGTGAIDHIALQGDDYDAFLAHVQKLGVPYALSGPFNLASGVVLRQINIRDPNEIVIEMNFPEGQPA